MKYIYKKIITIALALLISVPAIVFANTPGGINLIQGGNGWTTTTIGDILIGGSSTLRYNILPVGTTGQVMSIIGGFPSWVATSTLGIAGINFFSNSGATTSLITGTILSAPFINISATTSANTGINIQGNNNGFFQGNIQNISNGANASTDLVATADNGDDTNHYIDTGINGSGGSVAPFTGANEAYLYSATDALNIGALGTGNTLKFYTTGGTSPLERMRIGSTGNVGIGTTTANTVLSVNGTTTIANGGGIIIYNSSSTNAVRAATTLLNLPHVSNFGVPVLGLRPLSANTQGIMDIMGNGGSVAGTQYTANTDTCSTDILQDAGNWECIAYGKFGTSQGLYGFVSVKASGSGINRPLILQDPGNVQGTAGNIGVSTTTPDAFFTIWGKGSTNTNKAFAIYPRTSTGTGTSTVFYDNGFMSIGSSTLGGVFPLVIRTSSSTTFSLDNNGMVNRLASIDDNAATTPLQILTSGIIFGKSIAAGASPTSGYLQINQPLDTSGGGIALVNNGITASGRLYQNTGSAGSFVIDGNSTGSNPITLNESGGNV